MAYLVLARKYRPRRFAEMVGQEHVVQALSNALAQQRLHHAYLFTGTRGVGKTTVSRILAKSLNCVGPDGAGQITASPCGVCDACTQIDSGRFVDYTELDAASNRGVDEVQALLEQAVYKPVQGRFKVFMIDEVHMLSTTAFNAMLKTLEEPPPYLKFVLATTDPQKVPVTVLSRCLQFNLRPMAPATVQAHLQQVLAAEGVAFEPGALGLLARGARGSMRDALSLTDQAIAFGAGALTEAQVRAMLGVVDDAVVTGLLGALADADGAALVNQVQALRLGGHSADAALEDLVTALQRLAVAQAAPQALGNDASAALLGLAQRFSPEEVQLAYSLCLHGRAELGLAPDEYAALTMVLLRVLSFKPEGAAQKKSPDTGAGGVNPPQTEIVRLPVVSKQNQPVAPAEQAQAATVIEAVAVRDMTPQPSADPAPEAWAGGARTSPEGDFWALTVADLIAADRVGAMVRELALQSQCVARDADTWLLRVERAVLNQPQTRQRLTEALAQHGHTVTLAVEVGPTHDTPARRMAQAQAAAQLAAEAAVRAHPFVQQLMRHFGATIIAGSVQAVPAHVAPLN